MSDDLIVLSEGRYLDPDPKQRAAALYLYEHVRDLPLLCPHGHVNPKLFSSPETKFGNPTELLITPDHYIFRMLYSQGISLESMGVPPADGINIQVECDPLKIWQLFANHFHYFRGTPSGIWLTEELFTVFGIRRKINQENAIYIYEEITEKLESPEFSPRRLYEKFNIEVLSTTDSASDSLDDHEKISTSGWKGKIIPCFRPDAVVNIDTDGWQRNIEALDEASGINITTYEKFIRALENRRQYFKKMGARATDHAALTAHTEILDPNEAEKIFQRALSGESSLVDSQRFTGHMLMEMARMSIDDGLVMQLHVGSFRNHNAHLFPKFGRDKGYDIPIRSEFSKTMKPLLDKFGNNPSLTLILFTLDETTYSRELAPLAGHYPAVKIGPPWWFHDSLNGMSRYFDQIMETAGLYNTVGFNDDTRAFPSIPARHDVWRRVSVNWLAGLVVRHVINLEDAEQMAYELAYGLAKNAYKL